MYIDIGINKYAKNKMVFKEICVHTQIYLYE